MASKQVIDRQKAADYVIALSEAQTELLATTMAEAFGISVTAAKALLSGTFKRLGAERDSLVEADSKLAAEHSDDASTRASRDDVRQTTFDKIVRTRGALNHTYGDEAAADVFKGGKTPADGQTLARYGRQIAERLRVTKLPKPLAGMQLDSEALAKSLEADCKALEKALEEMAKETRETQAALEVRDEAMASFDRVFTAVTTQLEGYFWLADKRDLADRVRPSQRRPGTTVNPPPTPE